MALAAALALATPAFAQWPTACLSLNDIVEAHLGHDRNVGIYQRVFLGDDAERACRADHRADVRATFAWAFDAQTSDDPDSVAWPGTCVQLNDIVEAHLGNSGNVGIYQRVFGGGVAGESACRSDHRDDVRSVFAWAYGPPPGPLPRLSLPFSNPLPIDELAEVVLEPPWARATVLLNFPKDDGETTSCGSGFFVTSDGFLVTNYHVADEGPGWAWVRSSGELLGRALLVSFDPELDLALLKIHDDVGPYAFLGFGSSAALTPGADVLVAGYPDCEGLHASTGTVLSIGARSRSADTGYSRAGFRSSSEVEKGVSGSPVLNSRGRVVGVHTSSNETSAFHSNGDAARQAAAGWIGGTPRKELPRLPAPSDLIQSAGLASDGDCEANSGEPALWLESIAGSPLPQRFCIVYVTDSWIAGWEQQTIWTWPGGTERMSQPWVRCMSSKGWCRGGHMRVTWKNPDRISRSAGILEIALYVNGEHVRTDYFRVT